VYAQLSELMSLEFQSVLLTMKRGCLRAAEKDDENADADDASVLPQSVDVADRT